VSGFVLRKMTMPTRLLANRQLSYGNRHYSLVPRYIPRIQQKTRITTGLQPNILANDKFTQLLVLSECYLAEEAIIQNAWYRFKVYEQGDRFYGLYRWAEDTKRIIHSSFLTRSEKISLYKYIRSLDFRGQYDSINAENRLLEHLKSMAPHMRDDQLALLDTEFSQYVLDIANRKLIDDMLSMSLDEGEAKNVLVRWNYINIPVVPYEHSSFLNYIREQRLFVPYTGSLTMEHGKRLEELFCQYMELRTPFAMALEAHSIKARRTLEWIRGPQLDIIEIFRATHGANSQTTLE
jgi:hypothetical protein